MNNLDEILSDTSNSSHLNAVKYTLENEVSIDQAFLAQRSLLKIMAEYNADVIAAGLDESCIAKPTDSASTIRKRCKKAFGHGLKNSPMKYIYAVLDSPISQGLSEDDVNTTRDYALGGFTAAFTKVSTKKRPSLLRYVDDESGVKRDDVDLNDGDLEEETSTARVRKYYKRHPEKVRAYLKKTVKDRSARNKDRAKAVKKYGKAKMKNHDVHHPNGPKKGAWRLAKKDHGRDKVNESLILEGGAAGHLAHPFEDDELTFSDMKTMIDRGLVGGLDTEEPVTEKLDGQNIAFTVSDGQIKFARNKGQVKNKAKNALDVAGIKQMFAGRGDIEKAFTATSEDLNSAIQKLSSEQVSDLFMGGSKFMNLEIIFPDTQNVIPYGKTVLVVHGSITYDESGEEVSRSTNDGRVLSTALTKVNADKQKVFGITGPRNIVFSDADSELFQEKALRYKDTLDRAKDEFGLEDDDTLAEYKKRWWDREVDQQADAAGVSLTTDEMVGLVDRWAMGDKSFGVHDIKDPETKAWFREMDKKKLPELLKRMIRPIETTFLQAGAESLKRVTNFISSNNPAATEQLKRDTLTAIKAIRDSKDPNKIEKLQRELERLEAIGMDKIVPSEGIVFMYNGKPYKFTGTFAPINQITGTFKFELPQYEKEPEATPDNEIPDTPPPKDTGEDDAELDDKTPPESKEPKRTIAIFAGRFQPFHAGHHSVYAGLVKKFGRDNVFIASSDKTDSVRSPFSFNDKKDIITRMFDVPEDRVVQVKSPYAPKEILDQFPDDTTFVTAISQKDAERFQSNKYFRSFEETPEQERSGYKEQGYFTIVPEMQLTVKDKNVSGTQMRSVMGSDAITDRAKQEIFTLAYGKFDQGIFDKIAKITKQSEEAAKITQTYAAGKKPKKTAAAAEPTKRVAKQPSAPTKKPTSALDALKQQKPKVDADKADSNKQAMTAQTKQRMQGILKQKILNPKTKRQIFVATALTYDKNEPVRQAAEKLMKQGYVRTEGIITEDKKKPSNDNVIRVYKHTKRMSPEKALTLAKTLLQTEQFLKSFPQLAETAEGLAKLILDAPSEVLSMEQLTSMDNSEVGEIIDATDKKETLRKILNKEIERDPTVRAEISDMNDVLKSNGDIDMPIVIKSVSGYYLLTGNITMCILMAGGYNTSIALIPYHESHSAERIYLSTTPANTVGAKAAVDTKGLLKKVLAMKVRNPETGNMIKVDTAMDYKRTHPAHKLALGMIRQHMSGVSTRAGVAKKHFTK